MRQTKLLLLALLFMAIPTGLFAYTDGQIVTFNGNTYKVASIADHTLYFLGTDDSNSGELVIPEKVYDGIDITFTVTGVEYNSRYKCTNITSIKLPESIVYLGYDIFGGADLASINIPKNVKSISENVWAGLRSVPKQTVDPDNPYFSSDDDGALYSKDKTVLRSVPSNVPLTGGVYTVSDKVTRITNTCFRLVNDLTKIILPPNLQSISTGFPTIAPTNTIEAFEMAPGGSTPFTTVDGVLFKDTELMLYPRAKDTENYKVPDGVKSIASYAISNSWKMKSIDLNGVTKLAVSSIYAASLLSTIVLPKDIKKYDETTKEGMAEGCFEACQKVAEYMVPAENTDFVAKDGVIFSKPDEDILFLYPPSRAGDTYVIPASVKTIARRGFQSAQNITTMTIPAGVENIHQEAFRGVPKLTGVTFEEPSKVQQIGPQAFWSCEKLTEVTLPAALTSIGDIFYQCSKLETVNIPADSKLETIGKNAFSTNTSLKAFNFQGTCALKEIGENAFANLKDLQTFKFPKSVTSIKTNAFSGCSSMATVEFDPDADILSIGSGAFADCGLTSFDVPKKVQTIGREAFRNCDVLTTVNVTETTTSISPEAFKRCKNLTAINVSKKNTVYSSVDGYLLSKDKETLMIFPEGKANDKFTLLPPSIKKIGDYAFYDCQKLKNVIIPNKVISIGKRAFGLCPNLNTVTFLCDQMIDPDNINQATNDMSFDNGSQAADMFGKINVNVRQDRLGDYQTNAFYQKFKSISPSFTEGTEEYIAVSDNDVDLLSTSRTDHTFVLPAKVTRGGKDYNVSLVGDYAFQNAGNSVKEVVVKNNVKYIGAQAFVTDIAHNKSTVENVFFIESTPTKEMLSTTRFELDETGTNYNEFAPTTKIYVKKSALGAYQTAWSKTVYDVAANLNRRSDFDFTSQIDYRIKGTPALTNKLYSTFAREFDVDFGDVNDSGHRLFWNAARNCPEVIAFTSGEKIGNSIIRMQSISLGEDISKDGLYVPANTGVVLKAVNGSLPSDFYYRIGEDDKWSYSGDNILKPVTVNAKDIVATENGNTNFYISGGKAFRVSQAQQFKSGGKLTIGVHKAYINIDVPAGAKLSLLFDDGETTGIESLNAADAATATGDVTYYNLNGQRVTKPVKGLYIHNGKKVIVK